jgi:hypothetical protein
VHYTFLVTTWRLQKFPKGSLRAGGHSSLDQGSRVSPRLKDLS